jgi:flagellin
MTAINTNNASVLAANALKVNERKMSTAMERLSTGLRINSAKDDAAGLAITKKLNAQVTGLRQASRNANDGISMLQTFDGASKEISTLLNRMRDLTVQAANGTYSANDIASLGEEYTALRTEIGRIIDATQWNGMAKMDGDTGGGSSTVNLQIGANSGSAEVMALTIMDWDAGASASGINGKGGAVSAIAANMADGNNTVNGAFVILDADLTGGTVTNGVAANELGNGETFRLTVESGGITNVYEYTNNTGSTLSGALLNNTLKANITVEGYTSSTVTNAQTAVSTLSATTSGVVFQHSTLATDQDLKISFEKYNGGNSIPAAWANRSLSDIDGKIDAVTAERAKYGAYISRLESASDNLLSVAQNTDASRGQIEDADYAAETTELARTQIIAQAGTAMLAQANQIKQSVLALLK